MGTSLYVQNGTELVTTSVMKNQGTINMTLVEGIGLPELTASTIWGYLGQNLAIGALITHVILFPGKDMITAWRQARDRTQPDPHYQAMLKYKEVPYWWYLAVFVLRFFAGVVVTVRGDTTLPVWAYIISLLLGAFITPFSSHLYGLYGNGVATNQISKMSSRCGYDGPSSGKLVFRQLVTSGLLARRQFSQLA
jgi:hypothetical protein